MTLLHETMAANLAACGTPEHLALSLGPALSGWLNWSGSHACPTRESAGAYLENLVQTHGRAGAQSRFALFQIAAAYAWGAEETSHLAGVMRAKMIQDLDGALTGDAVYAANLARTPVNWRQSFEHAIATTLAGRSLPGEVHWSEARIMAVLASLAMWHEHCEHRGLSLIPSGVGFEDWAKDLTRADRVGGPVAATTVASYLERVYSGYSQIVSPGFRSTACHIVIDHWKARSEKELPRRSKAGRIVGASTLYNLGLEMVDEALKAPVRNLSAAQTCRNGILLSLGSSLPQRARALSWFAFDKTLFLELDFTIRVFLPAKALKLRETRKAKHPPFERTFRNPRLWKALDIWRRVFRPLYDDGDWLFPSKLSRHHGVSEAQLGVISRSETLNRLGKSISVHDLRDNVATEASEKMENGAIRASSLLGHRDPRTTLDHYDHAEDIRILSEHAKFIEAQQSPGPNLLIGCDDENQRALDPCAVATQKEFPIQTLRHFRPSPSGAISASNAAGG